jgi:hypothetical protein
MMMHVSELPFKVQAWTRDGQIDRLIATASNVVVARAAYDAAVALYPAEEITLRQCARVIAETKG